MNQIALVTGAGQGLGQSFSASLLDAGYSVVISDRDLSVAQSSAAKLDPTGERTLAVKLDVGSKADFENALAETLGRFGALHVVVNNAAVTKTTPLMEITPEEFDAVVGLNLRSIFIGCQVLGAYLAQEGYGRIINMASLAGQNGGTATGARPRRCPEPWLCRPR